MKFSLLCALAPIVGALTRVQPRDVGTTAPVIAPVLNYVASLNTTVSISLPPIPIPGGNLSVGSVVKGGTIYGPSINGTVDGGLFYIGVYPTYYLTAFYGYGTTSDNYTFFAVSSSVGAPGGLQHGDNNFYVAGPYTNLSTSFLFSDVATSTDAQGDTVVTGNLYSITN
ncbi:MAG: hypothetical protein CYPHOPRED_002081 [Cyphobasidiales sp. Tagirdzhanova-0007]|nr:MAG: hypothetical protein CYPHOPRED_002081 [Cyphobasidiales sp. Tagirdzhanova-0007]